MRTGRTACGSTRGARPSRSAGRKAASGRRRSFRSPAIADVVGAYGLSLIILFINVSIFFVVIKYIKEKKFSIPGITSLALLILIPIIYGVVKINSYEEPSEKIRVGVIQPDLNPNRKWEVGNLDQILDLYLSMSDSAVQEGAEIILWPETALPVYLLSGNYN